MRPHIHHFLARQPLKHGLRFGEPFPPAPTKHLAWFVDRVDSLPFGVCVRVCPRSLVGAAAARASIYHAPCIPRNIHGTSRGSGPLEQDRTSRIAGDDGAHVGSREVIDNDGAHVGLRLGGRDDEGGDVGRGGVNEGDRVLV